MHYNPKDLQILQEKLPQIRLYCKLNLDVDDLHGLGHVERVLSLARTIQITEGGDPALMEALVWFHDIGRKSEEAQQLHHAIISANMARTFLEPFQITPSTLDAISQAIKSHSFSIGGKPTIIEAQILSDADKIDAMGAVGIYRACVFQAGNRNGIQNVLAHIDEKLLKLKDLMILPTSKQLAQNRTQKLLEFKKSLLDELK